MRRPILMMALASLLLAACGNGDGADGGNGGNGGDGSPNPFEAAAEAELRNGLATANVFYVDGNTYTGFSAAAATDIEPALSWVDGAEPAAGQVSIVIADGPDVLLVLRPESGGFFCISGRQGGSLDAPIGSAAAFADVDTIEECTAA